MRYFKTYLYNSIFTLFVVCGCGPLREETPALRKHLQAELQKFGKKPLNALPESEQKKAVSLLREQINTTSAPFEALCKGLEPADLRKCLEFYQQQASMAKNIESICKKSPLSCEGTSKYLELLGQLHAQAHTNSGPATSTGIQKKMGELLDSELQQTQISGDLAGFLNEANSIFTDLATWKPSQSIKAIKTLAAAEKAKVTSELKKQINDSWQLFKSFCHNEDPAKEQECLVKLRQKMLVDGNLDAILGRSPLSQKSTSKYIEFISQVLAKKDVQLKQKELDLTLKDELKSPKDKEEFQAFSAELSNWLIKLANSEVYKIISKPKTEDIVPIVESTDSNLDLNHVISSPNLEITDTDRDRYFENITSIAQSLHEIAKFDAALATILNTIKSLPYELLEHQTIKNLFGSLSDDYGLIDMLNLHQPDFQKELLIKLQFELSLAAINQSYEPTYKDEMEEFNFA